MAVEPQTRTLPSAAALISPFLGQYAVIVFASLAGALWPLSSAPTATRRDGALLLLRLVVTAAALSGSVAWLIELKLGYPASKVMAPVAFAIAAGGDRWRDVVGRLKDEVFSRLPGARKGGE
jgi:hypothetical protein